MKFNQLKKGMQAMATVFGFSLLMVACNNSDESANNSTTATGESTADSLSGANASNAPSANNTNATKKKGRASAAIKGEDAALKIEKDKMGIYNRAEVAPAYGGNLETYIQDNIQYPQDAIDNSVEGTVQVQFAVDEKGNIINVSTLGNKLGHGLEEEAIKVVSGMPKWTPGQVKGKNVKTWRTLPITYQLES